MHVHTRGLEFPLLAYGKAAAIRFSFTEISFNLKILDILANYNYLTAILTIVFLSLYIPEMSEMKPIFL